MNTDLPFVIKPGTCRRPGFFSIFNREMSPVLTAFTIILNTETDFNDFIVIQNKIYKIDFLTGCNLVNSTPIDKLKGLLVLDDILLKGSHYNAGKYIDNLSEKRITDINPRTVDVSTKNKYRKYRLNLLYVRFALLCNIYIMFSVDHPITTVQIDSVDTTAHWKAVTLEKNKDTTIQAIKDTIQAIKDTRATLYLQPETIATIKNVSRNNDFNHFLENTFDKDLIIKSTTEGTSGTQIPTTNQQDMYQQFVNPSALTSDNQRARRDNSQQSKSRTPTPPPTNQNPEQSNKLDEEEKILLQIDKLEREYESIKDGSSEARELKIKIMNLIETLRKMLSKSNTGGNKRKTKKRSKNITKNKRKTKNTPLKIINRRRRFKGNVTDK